MSRRRRPFRVGAAGCLAATFLVGCTAQAPVPQPPSFEPTTTEPAPEPEPTSEPAPTLDSYGVNAGDAAGVEAGMQALAAGGNAVDAAVATAFALGVVAPYASGIGGGGAAVLVPPGGEPIAYDYREVVPVSGRVPPGNEGVPGFVAGMAALHAEYGSLPWADLLEPAITLAREGHPSSQMLADQLRTSLGEAATRDLGHFRPGGGPLSLGDDLVQPELAGTLERLADGGADEFYRGTVGRSLVDQVDGLDLESLDGYRLQVSDPPTGEFAGMTLVGASPPLPGAAVIQMLQIAEALGIAATEPGSADFMHQLSAAWAVAASSVESDFGDPAFVDVPVDRLTDAGRNAEVAASLADGAITLSAPAGPAVGETTHLTVVDADGFLVSMTNTLTNFWGSGRYVDGYFVNDQLSRFTVGASGSNQPGPGRRSVSWSSPMVVLDAAGRPVLGLGSPGGLRIPLVLGNVLVRWGLHGQSLAEAVEAPRFFSSGSTLEVEAAPPGAVTAELRDRGYVIAEPVPRNFYRFGSVNALEIDWESGTVVGTADTRREAAFAVQE